MSESKLVGHGDATILVLIGALLAPLSVLAALYMYSMLFVAVPFMLYGIYLLESGKFWIPANLLMNHREASVHIKGKDAKKLGAAMLIFGLTLLIVGFIR